MIKEGYKQFLLGPAGADKVRHSGRSLYAHLVGTHDLLQTWGNAEPVCVAGLFHSIYGTKHFRHQAWPLDRRGTIRELIGTEAELLAHVFCTVDRPKIFFTGAMSGPGLVLLQEIEAANLLEQGSSSRWLKWLLDTDISDGAKRAIDQYLKPKAA